MSVSVRMSNYSDCEYLASRLRRSDLDELEACSGRDPLVSLKESLGRSKAAWTATLDGEPIAIFGVGTAPHDPKVGIVWFLATNRIEEIPIHFLRLSRQYLKLMSSWYPMLTNFIDSRNLKTQDWLEWCGFKLLKVYPSYGVQRMPFLHYAYYA